jgi:hypothetical protein
LQQSNDGGESPFFGGIQPIAGGPEGTGPDRPHAMWIESTDSAPPGEPVDRLYGHAALRQNAPSSPVIGEE